MDISSVHSLLWMMAHTAFVSCRYHQCTYMWGNLVAPHSHHHFVASEISDLSFEVTQLSPSAARLFRWCVLQEARLGDVYFSPTDLGRY